MGATVSTAVAVEVVETSAGPGFLLYEQTYEKNCYPHTPHWGCVGVGRKDDVLRTIFRYAHVCEGGMLQGRGGHITPEGYIQRWKKALKSARAVEPYTIQVDRTMHPMRWADDPLEKALANVENSPLSLDRRLAWDAGEKLGLSLRDDFDDIAWLIAGGWLSAWRSFDGNPAMGSTVRDVADLVFLPRTQKTDAKQDFPVFMRLFKGEEDLFEIRADNMLVHRGWNYSVIGSYVAHYDRIEAADPGWYAQRIGAFREHVRASLTCSPSLTLEPVVPEAGSEWDKERARKMQNDFPSGVQLSEITDSSNQYQISNCPQYRILRPDLVQIAA